MNGSPDSFDSNSSATAKRSSAAGDSPGGTGLSSLWCLMTAGYLVVWLLLVAEWVWAEWLPLLVRAAFFATSLVVAAGWLRFGFGRTRRRPWVRGLAASIAFLLLWQFTVFATDALVLDALRGVAARTGLAGAFLLGLGWVIWGLERASAHYESERRTAAATAALDALMRDEAGSADPKKRAAAAREERPGHDVLADNTVLDKPVWNPLDPAAWYYGRRSRKLNQSLVGFTTYCAAFLLACLVLSQMRGCTEFYEIPAGGGQQQTIAQVVRIQKIIRKKFIVNPLSAIKFEVPPIDEVKLELTEITKHAYKVGYGEGDGAGFAGGTQRGKVRLIRLEYSGGDWDQDFGIGGDMNMLIKYYELTSHKVAEKTESRRIAQLANFPPEKSPPLVYMTGQKNISLSNSEIKILHEYLEDKHGMIFADNGGSRHFHNQFLAMMQKVLPDVRPVPIPLDDTIHRIPFQIPFLPYVAPHGGKDALGWWKDGRWMCYYHPGDIGDAWADGNAGVAPEIWKACYELGANVIFYAHAEYAKWLQARKSPD